MSHIVKGKATVAFTDKSLLVNALNGLGNILENAKLCRVGAGYTREKYGIVLVDFSKEDHRIGFNQEGRIWQQYQEDYGSYGQWTKRMAQLIQDRYLGFHYARELEAQGMKVSMNQMANGAIEIEAREMVW